MKVKPGENKKPNVEIQYKIWKSIVNPSARIAPEGSSVTYPNAAINKTRLDEQREDSIDPHKSTPCAQVFLHYDATLPMPTIWLEIIIGGQLRDQLTKPSSQSIRW